MWCSMSQRGGAALTAVLSSLSRRTISAAPFATTSFCATAPYFRMVVTSVPVAQPYAARLFQVRQLHASLATTKKRRGGAGVAKNGKSTGNDNDASTSGGGDEMVEVEEWDGQVPRSRIGVTASRSSGAGGQNVNKVSTKAELRFRVDDAVWLPAYGRNRLKVLEHGRITKDGEFIITSQKTRSLKKNTDDAFEMLRQFCVVAMQVPKETSPEKKARVVKLAKQSNERRLKEKRFRSEKLKQRRGSSKKDGW